MTTTCTHPGKRIFHQNDPVAANMPFGLGHDISSAAYVRDGCTRWGSSWWNSWLCYDYGIIPGTVGTSCSATSSISWSLLNQIVVDFWRETDEFGMGLGRQHTGYGYYL